MDEVYVLQHFEDMFETGNFEERMQIDTCHNEHNPTFFFFSNITSNNIKCLSFHGHTSQLVNILHSSSAKYVIDIILKTKNTNTVCLYYRTILFDHAEVALHDSFGDKIYWKARRSMRFSKTLRNIANEYRNKFLNSSDELDNTYLPYDWRDEKVKNHSLIS